MSIAVDHIEGPFDGVLLVHVMPTRDTRGLGKLLGLWCELRSEPTVQAVGLLSDDRHFSAAVGIDAECGDATLIGPKRHGLLQPFGVALRGDVFDFGLQLVADADVVIASRDVLLVDSSVRRGRPATHATTLNALLPTSELSRLALLGADGAMTAERAAELGAVSSIADVEDLRTALTSSLRQFVHAS